MSCWFVVPGARGFRSRRKIGRTVCAPRPIATLVPIRSIVRGKRSSATAIVCHKYLTLFISLLVAAFPFAAADQVKHHLLRLVTAHRSCSFTYLPAFPRSPVSRRIIEPSPDVTASGPLRPSGIGPRCHHYGLDTAGCSRVAGTSATRSASGRDDAAGHARIQTSRECCEREVCAKEERVAADAETTLW